MTFRLSAAAICASAFYSLTVAAEAATLDRIADSGTIKLGYRVDAAPFSYVNKEDRISGYSIALCEVVAIAVQRRLNRNDIKIEFVPVTPEDRFSNLQSGRIDLLCGATTVTLERRNLIDFSLLTFATGASVLYRKDGPSNFKELSGKKIGVRAGSTTEDGLERAMAEVGIAAEFVPVKDHQEGRRALEAGEIEAYFADRAILIALASEAENPANMVLSDRFFSYEPYALGMQLGDHQFRQLVDSALARLYSSPAIGKIYKVTFGNANISDLLRAMFTLNSLPE